MLFIQGYNTPNFTNHLNKIFEGRVNSDSFSQTVIKMKRDGGISIFPCKVNGLKLYFIFDTGASDVSLSMTEVSFMLKNGYLSGSDIIGSKKFSGAKWKY